MNSWRRRCLIACVAASCLALPLRAAQGGDTPAEIVDVGAPERPAAKGIAHVIAPDADPNEATQAGLPHAEIIPDGESYLGCWLLLDGTASTDPQLGKLEYAWRQAVGPPLPLAAEQLKEPKLWLFLSQPGQFRVALRVKNPKGWSPPIEAKFAVKPGRPFLTESEGRKVAGAGERADLPGEGWRQVSGPAIELRYEDGISFFRPGRSGLYIFEAPRAGDVPERRGAYVPPGRDGVLGDRRPLARLPKNLVGQVHTPLLLNGSLSRDPDGAEETQALTARWTTPEKYRGVELGPLPGLKACFKAPRAGTFSVSLVVSDGRLDSEPPETAFIRIEDPGVAGDPAAGAVADWDYELELGREDVRYRKATLGLWSSLDRAVQMFPSRCGVALRIAPEFASPEKFDRIPLALEVQDGAVLHLIDWIARQTDGRYRREGDRSLWLTSPLAWAREEDLKADAVQADALHAQPDGSDLMALLMPCFQQVLDARPGTSFAYERARAEIQCVLPASARLRLREICAVLREPEGQGLPPPELPSAAEVRLQQVLANKTVTLKKTQRRLVDLLRDLAQAGGVAVAFDPRQFPKDLPYVTVDIEDAPLRDAVRTIVDAAGFDGCSVEPPGGLWFFRGARPYPSGELLWQHALVRAYDLSRLLQQVAPLSGEAIAYAVRKRVYPDSWKEAGAAVFYHAPTKKLVVMHGPAAQRCVLEFLHDLAQRGEWALGPVE
ncbi:MAG: hypothetical protein NTW87_32365 [Planctomycetota bacterium]|nr:hypothetical protein [Planctomycetota bacterium]